MMLNNNLSMNHYSTLLLNRGGQMSKFDSMRSRVLVPMSIEKGHYSLNIVGSW